MASNGNDVNLRVGFDIDRFQKELQKTNGILNSWGANITKTLGSISVGFTALQIGKQVIQSLADFEAEMSNVKAVTNATQKEFEQLRNNALNLASAYGVTTKGVAELETQYARLGFTTSEILNSTKAAIQLSRATGEDLATSAQIAGSTLRAFNLDATEMNRIADVMAMSFNNTALGLADFGEAIKYVAPVAANAGISLEQTTAMLGVLADAGIKGSQAGTSLRKIISDLGQGAGPMLTKKLKEMAAAGLSGAAAMDEVGRTAYASLLVLSNNTRGIEKQTKALKESEGQLNKVASVVKDNLTGDWEKFTGTLDAFVQKGSAVNTVLRQITQSATVGLLVLQNLDKLFKGSEHGASSSFAYTNEDKASDAAKRYNEVMAAKRQAIQNLNIVLAENAARLKAQEEGEKAAALAAEKAALSARLQGARNGIGVLPSIDTVNNKFKFTGDENAQKAVSSMTSLQQHMKEVTDSATESINNQSNSFQEMATIVSKASVDIGEMFGSIISGSMTAAQAIGQYASKMVQQIGRVIMASLIQKAIQDKATDFNFFAKLALIGVAVGTASALLGRIGATGGGGGYSARSANVSGFTRQADRLNVNVTVEGKVSGQNLIWVMRNGGYATSKLGG